MLVREIVRFRGIKSDVCWKGGAGGGGESPVGETKGGKREDYIGVVSKGQS